MLQFGDLTIKEGIKTNKTVKEMWILVQETEEIQEKNFVLQSNVSQSK